MSHRIDPSLDPEWMSSANFILEGRRPSSAASQDLEDLPELPQRYGIPQLELLVVDPQFVFVSWELSTDQISRAADELGIQFEQRRLEIAIVDTSSGATLSRRSLYGEIGRWFIQLDTPGRWVSALLSFVAASATVDLHRTGPVFIPRNTILEPESYEELTVEYVTDAQGKLTIAGSKLGLPLWPDVELQPGDYLGSARSDEAEAAGRNIGASQGILSSAALQRDTSLHPRLPSLSELLPPHTEEPADD